MSIVTEVRQEIDESLAGVFWPDRQVFDAINASQLKAKMVPGFSVGTVDLVLASNTDLVSLPSVVMVPLGIVTDADEPCWITSHTKLEQYARDWKLADPDKPRWFVVFDAETLRVWPKPDQSYTYKLSYIPWPTTEITSGVTDFVDYPNTLRESIRHRACEVLLQATQPGFAEAHGVLADELEQTFRTQLRNQGGVNIKRFRPATNQDRARTGVIRPGGWYI